MKESLVKDVRHKNDVSFATRASTLVGKGPATLIKAVHQNQRGRMNSYWVTFTDHTPLCVDAETPDKAKLTVAGLGLVIDAKILPYPAQPRFNTLVPCPSFCHDPANCCGRTSCLKRYACSE